jgi:hypothetical protein
MTNGAIIQKKKKKKRERKPHALLEQPWHLDPNE